MTDEEILYDDGKIKVVYQPERDGHGLILDGQLIFLDHGVLEELARTSRRDLISKFNSVYPDFGYIIGSAGLSYETIGLVIAQARISELENELSSSYRKISNYLPKIIPVPNN